ncbi:MAG TPA: UDP-N-acetylmuramoyl-L-alanyl-D-glutamate--2,6-diaminopimelate ligase, partial [Alphaproteobacteria bacterium]|nr:UDP-N-acetylmuramoyl-L-alanyl-D-glutamate--2,6-diaminopimelate ligase [Alphaproteobacteria bacterium]
MSLLELIDNAAGVRISHPDRAADVHIAGLTADSRDVREGFVFAAFPGVKVDRRAFIDDAIARGAAAVLVPTGTAINNNDVIVIEDPNPRRRFSLMAAKFYGRQMDVITAVTGTNGKSSTVNFCRQIWQAMDHAAASLGTIGVEAAGGNIVGINRPGLLTTPDPVVLHAEIAELEAAGVTHLAFEASSIGLDQYRLDGVHVTAAAFTNLTRDHLDYHGTMEKYFDAKARLFSDVLTQGGVAVICMGSPEAEKLRDICQKRGLRVIEVGLGAKDIRLNERKSLPGGQYIDISVFGERYKLELPLVGDFQALNALTALGLVLAADPDHPALHMQGVQALERLASVRGRLELAASLKNGAAIYVDYAHTPDGLETMLKALRPHTQNKLHVVFGCGGDRDRGKRPMMGEISARLADVAIVTDDNPRTEDGDAIVEQILHGMIHPERAVV